MTLARTRLFVALVGLVCLIVAGLGIALIGGPGASRELRRDQIRLDALREIAIALRCQARAGGAAATSLGEIAPSCMASDRAAALVDPLTGASYRIDRPTTGEIRVCAAFESPARINLVGTGAGSDTPFDRETGCVSASLRP